MTADLEWYPAELVDESCPPHKSSPEAFVFRDGEHWQLGYPPGDTSVLDDDREAYNRIIEPGAVVDFMTADRLGDIEATLHRDGSYELHGMLPPSHNVVIVNGDIDLLYGSFDELIETIKTPNELSDPHVLIFEKDAESERVTLSFATWSDTLPHLFEVIDGKPAFRPIPAQKH